MIGVVLCGGQSIRMGSDKGLLKLNNITWVQTAFNKINSFRLPVVISVNKEQHEEYTSIFSAESLITDNDLLQIRGPLSGVLSVHLAHPDEDLLILACDMPLLETELLHELLTLYTQCLSYDAFIYTNDGEPEPLCGIYKAKALAGIYHLYKTNQLEKYSMKYMLEHLATHSTPLPDNKKEFFRKFNTHAEVNGL